VERWRGGRVVEGSRVGEMECLPRFFGGLDMVSGVLASWMFVTTVFNCLMILCEKGRVFHLCRMMYGFGSLEMIFVEYGVVEQGMEYGVPDLNDGFYVDGGNGGNWAILMACRFYKLLRSRLYCGT